MVYKDKRGEVYLGEAVSRRLEMYANQEGRLYNSLPATLRFCRVMLIDLNLREGYRAGPL